MLYLWHGDDAPSLLHPVPNCQSAGSSGCEDSDQTSARLTRDAEPTDARCMAGRQRRQHKRDADSSKRAPHSPRGCPRSLVYKKRTRARNGCSCSPAVRTHASRGASITSKDYSIPCRSWEEIAGSTRRAPKSRTRRHPQGQTKQNPAHTRSSYIFFTQPSAAPRLRCK